MNECTHEGIKHAFDIGNVKVYGSSKSDLRDGWINIEPSLIISLTGESSAKRLLEEKHGFVSGADKLLKRISNFKAPEDVPVLFLDWSDGKSPPVNEQFFRELVEDLKELEGNVVVHCIGGHGRTGTLLSILAHYSGAFADEVDVPQRIREVYCDKSVETKAQIRWLENHGVQTEIGPSKGLSNYKGRTIKNYGSKKSKKTKKLVKRYAKCEKCGTYNQVDKEGVCVETKNCENNKLPHWSEA